MKMGPPAEGILKRRSELRTKIWGLAAIVVVSCLLFGCSEDFLLLLQDDVNRYVNNLVSLTIVAADHGMTTPTGTVDVPASEAYAIQAVADSGYQFSGWEIVTGTPVFADSSAASTTVTLVDGNATIRPRFDVWTVGGVNFSPVPGTYQTAQNVTLTPVTAGASIRYTLDGTVPTESTGTAYTVPVNFPLDSGPTTLTAVAFKSGMTPSDPTVGVYRITGTVAAPTFSPSSATPSTSFSVSLSCSTSGATIRYTTDGSAPTTSHGTVYSTAIPVSVTTTIRAVAFKTDWTTSSVVSATYTIAWAKSYGTTTIDAAYSIVKLDGAFYIAGKSGTNSRRLARVEANGNLAWVRTYSQNALTGGMPAAATSSGVITIGGSESEVVGGYTVAFARASLINSSGATVWSRKYSPASFSEAVGSFNFRNVVALPDGSFAVAGTDYDDMRGNTYPDLLILGSDGSAAAGRYLGLGITSMDAFAVATSGSSVTGYLFALTPEGSTDIQLVALTSSYALNWSRRLAGSSIEKVFSVAARSSNEYLAVGWSNSTVTMQSSYDALLIRVGSTGTVAYTSYGSTSTDDEFRSVVATPDGGYIVAGSTKSAGLGGYDAWVVKFSSSDAIEWSKTYGGTADDRAHSIILSGDGGYVVCGESLSWEGAGDFWVLKLDASGNPTKSAAGISLGSVFSPYNNTSQPFTQTTPTPTVGSFSQFGSQSETLTTSAVTWTTATQYP